jgi:archaemetzincin
MKKLVLLLLFLGLACREPSAYEKQVEALDKAQRAITPLHKVKGKPLPGEWLATYNEPGQTFAEFRSQNASRNYEKAFLYIQPLGDFNPEQQKIVQDTAEAMEIFFGVKTKTLEPLSSGLVPAEARRINPNTENPQMLTGYILEKILVPRLPTDALAMIAFTPSDLWPGEGWNFVFGMASYDHPVGVWSLYRMGDPKTEYPLCLQRTLKIALHETGHMLGIKHCTAYECGMNGTNSLDETDRHPTAFCPVCERKLWWALELERRSRYQKLADYAAAKGLKEEEKFWRDSWRALPE